MSKDETRQFEVFVTKLCDGNLKKCMKEPLENHHRLSIINQLLDTVITLKRRNKQHNDVKPGNVLYEKKRLDSAFEIKTKLADFGICNRSGGTPGWSPPNFTIRQKSGDVYSVGLVILFVLCEDASLFYAIRDNFIQPDKPNYRIEEQVLIAFRKLPEIKLIRQMIHPVKTVSLNECKKQWQSLLKTLEIITRQRLIDLGIPAGYLKLQTGTVDDRER